MKSVWLTSLVKEERDIQQLITRLKGYGLEVNGHFWEDNLDKMAWINPRDELISRDTEAWLIYIKGGAIERESVRYGLSLLILTVLAQRGQGFPVIGLVSGEPPDRDNLPNPLRTLDIVSADDPSAFAKIVARLHAPPRQSGKTEYRIDVYGNPQIGQWFEIGPVDSMWKGAIFGISKGEIVFQAVGPSGRLPSHAVLNYPVQGMKLELKGREFTAWGVRNELDGNSSYFIKVDGYPGHIIFGPFPEEDNAEIYTLRLG